MPNTVTQQTLWGSASTKRVIRAIHLVSDGSEETDLVVYDNSAFVANTGVGRLIRAEIHGAFTGAVRLEWDQSTDAPICSLGANDYKVCYRKIGGHVNPAGTGATGDIVLTTTALANLDEFTLIIEVEQTA